MQEHHLRAYFFLQTQKFSNEWKSSIQGLLGQSVLKQVKFLHLLRQSGDSSSMPYGGFYHFSTSARHRLVHYLTLYKIKQLYACPIERKLLYAS